MASYAPAMQFSQAFALIEKQATRWYQSEPFTMKFSSQKKAVTSVVAASIVLGLVLVALSSNSASNQVNFLNCPVFLYALLPTRCSSHAHSAQGVELFGPLSFMEVPIPALLAIHGTTVLLRR